jgi:CelD/BcsL family acetyltransferase involved in cellulose biosynthesis
MLQGLAPLMSSNEAEASPRLELIGDLELCDYLDVLIVPAQQREVGCALVEHLVAYGGEDLALCFHNLSQHSPTPALFHDCLVQHGLTVEVGQIETCPTAVLATEWEAYLATLRSKDRHELRRKLRRAEAAVRLEYRVTSVAAQLDEDVDTFIALHRLSQQDAKQGFMTPEKEAFLRDVARELWPHGWLELGFLSADGEPIAALCCFAYGTTYAAYNSGYHPAYADLSAGIVLFAECIRQAIARHGALSPLTSCAGMSPTNIAVARRISRSTNCWPVPPVRCRGRVYEWCLAHQPRAAPDRDGERA